MFIKHRQSDYDDQLIPKMRQRSSCIVLQLFNGPLFDLWERQEHDTLLYQRSVIITKYA